jgi:hypothetical protein
MDDRRIETHPDLMNPDWQKHAEREAWLEVNKSRRRAKRGRVRQPGLMVVVALLALIFAAVTVKQLHGSGANNGVGTATAPTTPTTAPSVLPRLAAVDLTQPFISTPAALWKDGAAGISTPAPSAIGAYSPDQVASGFDKVTHAISEAHLDRKTLEGHDTTAYLASFAPNQAKIIKTILDMPDKFRSGGFVTRIADGFHLLPVSPRINGRLSAQPGANSGELIIHAEYVVAYAFDTPYPEQLRGPGDIVAFVRNDESYLLRTGSHFFKADQGLSFGDGTKPGEVYSMACTPFKAGYIAPSYSEPAIARPGGTSGQDETAIFDLNKPMSIAHGCGT